MKKIFLSGLFAGIAMLFGNLLINPVLGYIFPALQEYYKSIVFRQVGDPYMFLFFLYPIILGFALSLIWSKVKSLLPANFCYQVCTMSAFYIFAVVLPMFLINYSSFTFPVTMILSWCIMSIVNAFVAFTVLAKMNKQEVVSPLT